MQPHQALYAECRINTCDTPSQEEQPHEYDQCELGEKQVRRHGNAPSPQCERGALYLAVGARQLSAAAWCTTSGGGRVLRGCWPAARAQVASVGGPTGPGRGRVGPG